MITGEGEIQVGVSRQCHSYILMGVSSPLRMEHNRQSVDKVEKTRFGISLRERNAWIAHFGGPGNVG